FYEEVLGQSASGMDPPDLTAIARDADTAETLRFAQLVVALAVQCENNQKYIIKIQMLEQESQHALMLGIETVRGMEEGEGASGEGREVAIDLDSEIVLSAAILAEKSELEKRHQEVSAKLETMETKYDEILAERNELRDRLHDMERSMSELSEAGKIDFLLRTEIDNLKADVERSEVKRLEAETVAERQLPLISDLTRKVEDLSQKAEEAAKLKDQLDEFRHMADKLQKSEAIIEKYKKKLEESADLRKHVKALEDENLQQGQRNAQLEEEYRRVSSFKPLMDTYKEQIGALERKNTSLAAESSAFEHQLREARLRVERFESERRTDQEHIQVLEDRVRDLEL
ncbi:hook-related protein family, partial [Blyttiomyces helicus]